MALENYSIMDSLPWFVAIPLGFVATKYISLSNRMTKSETKITALEKRDVDLATAIDKLTDAVNANTVATANLCGRLDEHLRK